jgi:hypothetical protein
MSQSLPSCRSSDQTKVYVAVSDIDALRRKRRMATVVMQRRGSGMSMRKWVLTVSIVLAGSWAAARPGVDGPWKAVLPEAEFAKLVTFENKLLQEHIGKGLDEKRNANRARVSALMIAGFAQSSMMAGGAKADQLAGLRDLAIKAAKAVEDGKTDEAKKLADSLTPTAKGEAGAKTEPTNLNKLLDLEELMHQFKPERAGGKDLEKKIKTFTQKRAALTTEELKDATVSAYQTAIIAQFTIGFAPAADQGKKKKADWVTWSQEMGELAVAAAKASSAAKPDDKGVKAAFKKLDDACAKCHTVFKDK